MMSKRNLQKAALILAALVLFAVPTWATSIDFAGVGNGGTWSWDGSGSLVAAAQQVQIQTLDPLSSPYTVTGSQTELISTGAFLGGSGTMSDPWTFGPGPANSITITGCEPLDPSCSVPVTLFSGQFTDNQSLIAGDGGLLLEAPSVTGTVDPGLLTDLGLAGVSSTSVSGMMSFSLNGNPPGDVTLAGDLIVADGPGDGPGSPAPEPVSMVLMGTGLLALGLTLRLKGFGAKRTRSKPASH